MRTAPILLAFACGSAAPPPARVAPPPAHLPGYDDTLRDLASLRLDLATKAGEGMEVRGPARDAVTRAIRQDVMPFWFGTTWEFYGTTEIPGEGTIACGYFVSTVLRDAGFLVDRVLLAQQPAEHIIKTLVPPADVARFRNRPVQEVVQHVAAGGPGLWLVGLDYHVGFLHTDGQDVEMCHSSYLDPGHVVCEPALTSEAMVSRYRVVGRLMSDEMLDAWLEQTPLPTVVWNKP
jgi:hypothetical protein